MMQSLKGIYIRIGATCSEIDMRKITLSFRLSFAV